VDASSFLRIIRIEEHVGKLHEAITKKFAINNMEFDAWYTNRDYVLRQLAENGRAMAMRLRSTLGFTWQKGISEELRAALHKAGTQPTDWEDGPDGTLSGVAILVAGWVANQAAAKTRDNPQDAAKELFEKHVRSLILASMDVGVKMAEREGKT